MKKTITIKKDIPKSIIIGFLVSFILVFTIEHFSDFSYIANTGNSNAGDKVSLVDYVSSKTLLQSIYMDTPFGSRIAFKGQYFTVGDMRFIGGEFKPYTNRIKYFFKATFVDFKYVLLIGFVLAVIIYTLKSFKIRVE